MEHSAVLARLQGLHGTLQGDVYVAGVFPYALSMEHVITSYSSPALCVVGLSPSASYQLLAHQVRDAHVLWSPVVCWLCACAMKLAAAEQLVVKGMLMCTWAKSVRAGLSPAW